MAEALAGSPSAFSVLVKRYTDRIFRVALSVVGDEGLAEDVLQETFVRAFERLSSFSGRAAFRTWLYRIALNEAYRERGKRARRRERPFSAMEPEAMRPVLDLEAPGPAAGGVRRRVLELLESLPREYRNAMVLRHVDGLSYDEIADVLGTTAGTVGSWLHRARETLRERAHGRES